MFRYLAGAADFMDCETRQRVPVAMEGTHKALQADYLKMRQQPGEELLVTLEGRVIERASVEGDRPVPTFVVDRYIGIWPGETCGAPGATSPLQDTYWKLTRVQGKPVIVSPKQREAGLTLRKQENDVTGFTGCNDLSGSYTLKGNKITFKDFAATLLACLDVMETESAFLQALKTVRSWRIVGEHLELYNNKGAMVARLEARALR
jgi:copper homeostasis protein (lipoprotein)